MRIERMGSAAGAAIAAGGVSKRTYSRVSGVDKAPHWWKLRHVPAEAVAPVLNGYVPTVVRVLERSGTASLECCHC